MEVLHIERLFCYRRCLFSTLELDARYKWQVMAQNTHRNVFPFRSVFQHTERLFCYRRRSLCDLELHERSDWELRPQTRIGRSLIQHCMRMLQARTYIPFLVLNHACMITKLTYLMTAGYTTNDGFTTKDASFSRKKLASYTTRCSVF